MGSVIGVVAIGRDEGGRLLRCLRSVSDRASAVVYVDSGSRDESALAASRLGALVVELDASLPFTAARARNAGFERLRGALPGVELVQFVDGDCELQPGWLEAAAEHLERNPDVGVVCGRRRERSPETSAYNRLVDVEWDGPPGDVGSCGGDAMIRASEFDAVGGYCAQLIAGEDPDLCLRIRERGSRIVRLDREMTLHDAELLRLSQWWRRQVRSGHAFAEAVFRHRRGPDPHRVRRLASILLWGGALPAVALAGAWPSGGWSLLLLGALAIPWVLSYRDTRSVKRRAGPESAIYASACLLAKLAEVQGVATFAWNHLARGRASALIEYKRSGA